MFNIRGRSLFSFWCFVFIVGTGVFFDVSQHSGKSTLGFLHAIQTGYEQIRGTLGKHANNQKFLDCLAIHELPTEEIQATAKDTSLLPSVCR